MAIDDPSNHKKYFEMNISGEKMICAHIKKDVSQIHQHLIKERKHTFECIMSICLSVCNNLGMKELCHQFKSH